MYVYTTHKFVKFATIIFAVLSFETEIIEIKSQFHYLLTHVSNNKERKLKHKATFCEICE